MTQTVGRLLSFLLLLLAAMFAFQRAQEPEYIGIDFVQFHLTGQHVVHGGDPHVYSDKVRREILERAWQEVQTEGIESKFYQAVNFRHERSWESYSSPFLYSVFGAVAGISESEAVRSHKSLEAPSSGLSATFSPYSGEKGRSEVYERAINRYWIVCLGSTMIGFITFGWVLRIPGWSMLFGAVILVWFSPLRIDMNVANVDQIQLGMVGVLAAIVGRGCHRAVRGIDPTDDRSEREVAIQRAHHAERDGYFVRQFLARGWLGMCLAFKPSLLWCGVMWLGPVAIGLWNIKWHDAVCDQHDRRQLIAALIGGFLGGIIAVAFSTIWFPLHVWIEWIQAVRLLPDEIMQTHQGNFSPTYYARSCGVPGWLTSLAGTALAGVVMFVMRDQHRHRMDGTSQETRSTDNAMWLAIGCQIHLLTSNLVWYQYCVLSLPAVLVVLREVACTSSRRDAIFLCGMLLWCLLLLGFQPVDDLVASPSVEHMWRCTIANTILLILIVVIPKANAEVTGREQSSIAEKYSRTATLT